jgi:hypothetical protein
MGEGGAVAAAVPTRRGPAAPRRRSGVVRSWQGLLVKCLLLQICPRRRRLHSGLHTTVGRLHSGLHTTVGKAITSGETHPNPVPERRLYMTGKMQLPFPRPSHGRSSIAMALYTLRRVCGCTAFPRITRVRSGRLSRSSRSPCARREE